MSSISKFPTLRYSNGLIPAILLLGVVVGCSQNQNSSEPSPVEEFIEIPLDASILREPLVSLVLPRQVDQDVRPSTSNEAGSDQESQEWMSRDRVRFGKGMLITQPANPNKPGRVTGFKLDIPATGDFEIVLTLKIHRLDQPTERGAHGLAIRSVFRDSDTPLVVFGCMSSTNHERCLVKRVKRGDEKPQQSMEPLDFTEGKWIITRQGSVLFLIIETNEGQLIASDSVDDISGNLESTEFWCNRLPQGNAHAEIELLSVSIRASEIFPVVKEPDSYLSLIRWMLLVVVVILGVIAYRNRE